MINQHKEVMKYIPYVKSFLVFWYVIIKPSYKSKKEPEAIFKIRFLPKNMSVEENKNISEGSC